MAAERAGFTMTTSRLRKQIAASKSIVEALQILQSEPQASGGLKIRSISADGILTFSAGRLTGAAINLTGEGGENALEKLLNAQQPTIRYAKFQELLITPEQRIEIPLASLVGKLLTAKQEPAKDEAGVPDKDLPEPRAEICFDETHPQLTEENPDEQLKRRIAELGEVAVDDKPFEFVEKRIPWDIPSLTEEQRKLLKSAQEEAGQGKNFEEMDKYLQEKGLFLSQEQLSELQKLMEARSPEQQRAEFHESDSAFVTQPIEYKLHAVDEEAHAPMPESDQEVLAALNNDEVLKHTLEPEAPPVAEPPALDEIPTPKVFDGDKRPLQLVSPTPEIRRPRPVDGLIGRVAEWSNAKWYKYVDARKRQVSKWPLDSVVGILILCCVSLGLFILPAKIRSGAGGANAEAHARTRLQKQVHEELASDAIQEEAELPPRMSAHTANRGESQYQSAAPASAQEATVEQLRFGRVLVAKGMLTEAVPYYEEYMQLDPNSVPVRIELINLYIATKHRYKARLLCLRTLKRFPTSAQIGEIWQLLAQCQTD